MFKDDNNEIYVPVTDSDGQPIPASDFIDAIYGIYDPYTGDKLFEGRLGQEIQIDGDQFKVTTARLDHKGATFHEMRVKDVTGKISTIVQQTITINDTRGSL
jgi:hypothetical protein